VREINRWRTDIFRPFPRAADFAAAIKKHRSNWQGPDLKELVAHLEDNTNLMPAKMETKSYAKVIPNFNGYYDKLPATKDHALIRSLLKKTVFKSAMNAEWKRSGDMVTFAPATDANFHIVPKHHIAGLLENTEKSCAQCHNRTGQPLGQLDRRAVLYGEIWGEDQIFTWHPFKPITEIYSVSDGSRVVHPKLQEAGLLLQKKPAANDPVYRELPKPYSPVYK
jgi:phenylpropionate dioxygenase-like ring-hydroxylating dioxygenase large terminal subunit